MTLRKRRAAAVLIAFLISLVLLLINPESWNTQKTTPSAVSTEEQRPAESPLATLEALPVKGRAPKTGYARAQFGDGWRKESGCDMRNIILHRDLEPDAVSDDCKVLSGILHDPYTGKKIEFRRGPSTSDAIQIDHVVALSNAWQTGAQLLTYAEREDFANDPLNLLAVDGPANQQKGDGDAATWLPKNKIFRCEYISRQIAVKQKYRLWVVQPEKNAMLSILKKCL